MYAYYSATLVHVID